MDNAKLISKIFFEIQKDPSDYRAYEDVFSLCRSIEESDFKLAHDTNAELRSYISRGMKTSAYAKLFDLYRRSLLFDAPYKFDSYLLYIEINRKPEERFYQPRRRILKQVVDNLQKPKSRTESNSCGSTRSLRKNNIFPIIFRRYLK